MDKHPNDGSEERYIEDIKEDQYDNIADLAIPGVPENYEAFTKQVELYEVEKQAKQMQGQMQEFEMLGGRVDEEPSDDTNMKSTRIK